MKKLFTFLLLISFSTIIFAQQKEYYVAGINLSSGDTLKFGVSKNEAITIVLKKMKHKDEFAIINDTIIFDNVILDGENYDIMNCYFGENKLYKIILKSYITAEEFIKQFPQMQFNIEVQKQLINHEIFVYQQIFKDSKSKYNLK